MAAKKPAKKAAAKKAAPKKSAKKGPVNTETPVKAPKKPVARKDMTKPGPLGSRNGSGSIPYQGTAPQQTGGTATGGYGI